MNLDAELYSPRYIPLECARNFVVNILPQFGWGKSDGDEIILDVGCGPGGTTKKLILPLFSSSSRIFGFDVVPDMIDLAMKQNSSPQIEYSVADIEDWSSLQHWENQITKLVSISVFQWLDDQRNAFHHVHRLLRDGGEAALLFPVQANFFNSLLEMQNSQKWNSLFKGIKNYVPESQYKGHDASYYKKLLEEVGFEVLYCKSEEKIDVFASEESCRDFFTSICVLRKYVPAEKLKEFEEEFMGTFHKMNGRNGGAMPIHKGHFMELVVRKKRLDENLNV